MTLNTRFIVGNIGNTHSEFAIADCGSLVSEPERISTHRLLGGALPPVLDKCADFPMWIASVVPLTRKIPSLSRAHWVSAESCNGILAFTDVDTATLGADRIANSVAAVKTLVLPALIIDCGTAVTFELIDAMPAFCGGAILPGRKLMRTALNTGTAQLPELPLEIQLPLGPGKTTRDAIAIGIDCGIVGAVEAVRKHLLADFSGSVNTYVTGGDAAFFLEHMADTLPVAKYFSLQGVAWIAHLNSQS